MVKARRQVNPKVVGPAPDDEDTEANESRDRAWANRCARSRGAVRVTSGGTNSASKRLEGLEGQRCTPRQFPSKVARTAQLSESQRTSDDVSFREVPYVIRE